MSDAIEVRISAPDDNAAIEALYPLAFPDEDLVPLVRELLAEPNSVLSLVAIRQDALVGHVAFTACGIAGRKDKAALLGPLAVSPSQQGQGTGSELVRTGLRTLEHAGVNEVYVLGDPEYYKRFGFQPNTAVKPPYRLPEEWRDAWQSLSLAGTSLDGKLTVPPLWQHRTLWAP